MTLKDDFHRTISMDAVAQRASSASPRSEGDRYLEPSEIWTDAQRIAHQRARLGTLLAALVTNPFYVAKYGGRRSVDDWANLPFTSKSELSADQAGHQPFGSNLTYALDRYTRLHQTSGTTGRPLRILDTAESWEWWQRCWEFVYRAAGVTARDRIFFCFSFGPFVGFWSAFSGAERIGALCISGGAQSTAERAASIIATNATVLVCTPTYALRLAETAREQGIDLVYSSLRVSVHAGEPGASIPTTRARIESALGVCAFDHAGATEVGAYGFSCEARDGLHVIEREFVAEIRDSAGNVASEGEGELVLTNLGRLATPAVRYRTGDHVKAARGRCECGRTLLKLQGGIIGRVDDMVVVRGVNVYPSSIEAVVRRFPEVGEFRLEITSERGMSEIKCVVEARADDDALLVAIADAIHRDIGIRCTVTAVAPGILPRSDMKANRVVRR
ncbi:MAG: phenylacetate--CoA ligase family protein [Chloroflexota bacterium]|nr:phenylacetate--CoA ligase family protein [Chloroflexota bacterium]